MDLYQRVVRPVLFRLPADTAHRLAQLALRWPLPWRLLGSGPDLDPRLVVERHGLRFPNPVGLAPGFDKDGDALASLQHVGFGFLTPGAILRDYRAGNPAPRLARLVEQEALLNCMGLPTKGRAHVVARLKRLQARRVPVIGEVQGISPQDILDNVAFVQPHVEALELTTVCVNTHDTDANEGLPTTVELIHAVGRLRTRPVVVKVPHWAVSDRALLAPFLDACIAAGLEGVAASATRRQQAPQLSMGAGNLSGRPIFADNLRLVQDIASHAAGRLSIIASGGVWSGRDAYEMLSAGASLVEIYTALIYRGWMAPALINRELLAVLDAEGVPSVQALVDRSGAALASGARLAPL